MQIKFIWICWGDADWRRSTCGDRALQNCYSGKYHVFTGIRRPLSVSKISRIPNFPRIPAFPAFPCFPGIPNFPGIPSFPSFPRHPQISTAASPVRGNSLAYSKWIVINIINCQPIVINCLIIISELARLFDADRRRFSIILSCSRFFNGFAV